MPKVTDIMKSSIGLGIKVACSHFIILTTAHLKTELQQYAGKHIFFKHGEFFSSLFYL